MKYPDNHYFLLMFGMFHMFVMSMLIQFSFCDPMQVKHGDDVVVSISQIMDLLEVGDTQSWAKLFHEFLDYQKHLQQFIKVENELKDNLK